MLNKELIYREDLIAEYDRVHVGEPGGARKLMVDAPAVDAVEIVRCKNCTRSNIRTNSKIPLVWCEKWDNIMRFDDFCCYGVRKGD